MLIRKLFKNRGMAINMLACLSFLALAIYGWGLSWQDLLSYLLISLIGLAGVLGFAVLAGFLLRKFMHKNDRNK